MKYIPITQEVFRELVGAKQLTCKYISQDLGTPGCEKTQSYDYFLHPYTKVPFAILHISCDESRSPSRSYRNRGKDRIRS